MDKFFDRLGDILRSLLEGAEESSYRYGEGKDPYMRAAVEELDEYLRTGRSRPRPGFQEPHKAKGFAPGPDERLRKDYANLETPFGAPFAEVNRAHKRLLRKYHPDHFSQDPEKYKLATEITQKLNESFQRIRESVRSRRSPAD